MLSTLSLLTGVFALVATAAIGIRTIRHEDPAWVRLAMAGCGVVLAIGGTAGVILGVRGEALDPPTLAVLAVVFGTVAVVTNRDSRE